MFKVTRAVTSSVVVAVPALLAGVAQASSIDLTTAGAAGLTSDGGIVVQGSGGGSAGSGTFSFIYKVQSNSEGEAGVNDPDKPLDTKSVSRTALRLSNLVSAGNYYEFALDVNENSNSIIYLDSVQIYLSSASNPANITAGDSAPYTKLGTQIFDLGSASIKLDASLESGSGKADMLLYVPKSLFVLPSVTNPYVYLYSRFSANDAGFEEWGLRSGSSSPLDPTATVTPSHLAVNQGAAVPAPAAVWGGAGLLGLLGATKRYRRREQ